MSGSPEKIVTEILNSMALIKQAKICFRFLFFFHLGSFLFLKEVLRKSV